jgi:hypothetical protein
MFRFFCSTCNAVKRVHSRPRNVLEEVTKPSERIGCCNWHGANRAIAMNRVRFTKHIGSTRKLSSSSQKTKSK